MDPSHASAGGMAIVVPKSFDALVYIPTSTAAVFGMSAREAREMQREIHDNGSDWHIAGIGFDDVTTSTNSMGARLMNADPLNASPNYLLSSLRRKAVRR